MVAGHLATVVLSCHVSIVTLALVFSQWEIRSGPDERRCVAGRSHLYVEPEASLGVIPEVTCLTL